MGCILILWSWAQVLCQYFSLSTRGRLQAGDNPMPPVGELGIIGRRSVGVDEEECVAQTFGAIILRLRISSLTKRVSTS
jgi:hypothetical protein